MGSKGTRFTRLYDANQDDINVNYGEVDTFSSNTSSTYNALQVQARFSKWHHFSGFSAYVFSKCLDGASDGIDFNFATAAFPQNSDNLQAEKVHPHSTRVSLEMPRGMYHDTENGTYLGASHAASSPVVDQAF